MNNFGKIRSSGQVKIHTLHNFNMHQNCLLLFFLSFQESLVCSISASVIQGYYQKLTLQGLKKSLSCVPVLYPYMVNQVALFIEQLYLTFYLPINN